VKVIKTVLSNGSRKAVVVLAAFGLLLGGFLGVAAATPAGESGAATLQKVVGERTDQVKPGEAKSAGTLAAISYRHLWCGVSGDFRLNLTGLGAYDGQAVAVTVSEAGTSGSEVMGAARMRVNNVAVWAGNVTVWVSVEWGSPLCIWTHYLAI
jgi:hypothetical protein